MSTLTETLAELLEQSELDFPTSLGSVLAQRNERAMKRVSRAYLDPLYDAFPMSAVLAVLRAMGIQEQETPPVPPGIQAIIDEWMLEHGEGSPRGIAFVDDMTVALEGAALGSAAASLADWAERLSIVIDTAPSPQVAADIIEWARDHAGQLIKDIDDTTRDRIGKIIADGLANQDGVDQIRRSLESFIDDPILSQSRAETIARTEVNIAQSQGAFRQNTAIGATEKEWIYFGGEPSEVCQINMSEGRIPMNDAHASGDMFPPAHPRGRCVEVYHGVTREKIRSLR